MLNTCLFKQGRHLYNKHVNNNFVNMSTNKKRFIVLNEDEVLAEEVKKFPCLYDENSRSYQDKGVVIRNALNFCCSYNL